VAPARNLATPGLSAAQSHSTVQFGHTHCSRSWVALPAIRRTPTRRLAVVLQLALVCVCALFFVSALRTADLERSFQLVSGIGVLAVLIAIPTAVNAVWQAAGWRIVLARLGQPLRIRDLWSVRIMSEAFSLSLPAGPAVADSMAVVFLRRLGVPVSRAVAAVAARKTLVVGANGAYVLLAFAVGYASLAAISKSLSLGGWLPWLVLAAAISLLGAATALSAVVFSGRLARRVLALLELVPITRFRAWLCSRNHHFDHAERDLSRLATTPPRDIAKSLGAFFLSWLCEAAETMLILHLVGVPLGVAEVLSIEVIVSLLRAFAFALPGAVGIQEAGYVALLAALGVPDAATTGVAFVVLKRSRDLFWIAAGYAWTLARGRHAGRAAGPIYSASVTETALEEAGNFTHAKRLTGS
jgi:glycosyltransferase 2 family protein